MNLKIFAFVVLFVVLSLPSYAQLCSSVTRTFNCRAGDNGLHMWSVSPSTGVIWHSDPDACTLILEFTLPGNYDVTYFVPHVYSRKWDVDLVEPTGGTVSSSVSRVCKGGSATMTLTGHDGTVVGWEFSWDGGSNYTPINHTGASYAATNLQRTTHYRAIVSTCTGNEISLPGVVNVDVPGVIDLIEGSGSACEGTHATGTIQASDFNGIIDHWEQSEKIDGQWGNWENAEGHFTHNSIQFSVYVPTRFRAVVMTASCEMATGYIQTGGTIPPSVAGHIVSSAAQEVCVDEVFSLSVTGNTGSVQEWFQKIPEHDWVPVSSLNNLEISRTTLFKARVQNQTCAPAETATFEVKLVPAPVLGTLSTPLVVCDGQNTVLTLTSSTGQSNRWQRRIDGEAEFSTVAQNTNLSYTEPAQTAEWRVETVNRCNVAKVSPVVKVNATPKPSVPVDVSDDWKYDNSSFGLAVSLEQYDYQAKWYAEPEATGTPLYTGRFYTTPVLFAPQRYYVRAVTPAGCTSDVLEVRSPFIQAEATPSNHTTEVVRIAGISSAEQLAGLEPDEKTTQHTYFDGMGRTVQTVLQQASPLGKDVVQIAEYDHLGRAPKTYLPYVAPSANGAFKGAFKTEQADFYAAADDKIANDASPFAITKFEASPLERVIEQGAPGSAWQPGTGHTSTIEYSFNTSADAVRQFDESGSSQGFYGPNKLHRREITDPDDNETIIFADAAGKTILERKQLDEEIGGAMVDYLETYHIYDGMGQEKYVVSPKGVAALEANGWSFTTDILDQYVHQFVYDARGRLIEKKVPGQAWMYNVYDKLNRLVLTQDGLLRAENKWMFVKYDKRGRAVMQGLYRNTTQTTRAGMQLLADGLYTTGNALFPFEAWYETKAAAAHGYTNISFPKLNSDNTNLEVLNVNYYDSYDFDNNGTADFNYAPQGLTGEGSAITVVGGMPTGSKRRVIGSTIWLYNYVFYDKHHRAIQVRSSNHLNTTTVNDLSTMVYAFDGRVLYKKTYQDAGMGREVTVLHTYKYDDAGRLKAVFQNNNNAPSGQLVALYQYNEAGQLVAKKLHGTGGPTVTPDPQVGQPGVTYANTIVSPAEAVQPVFVAKTRVRLATGFSFKATASDKFTARIGLSEEDARAVSESSDQFMQVVDYRYDIQGKLISINNADLTAENDNAQHIDYFGMELLYNDVDNGLGNTARYNGNISGMKWKGAGKVAGVQDQKGYAFTYDKNNRLETAGFKVHGAGAWDQEVSAQDENVSYDHNGNIMSLLRNQRKHQLNGVIAYYTSETMDDLSYAYNSATGDRLDKVEDAATSKGFDNGSSGTATDYTYDLNGNLAADENKGIDSVHYNFLGKVRRIKFSDGRVITYAYDAAGAKLAMKYVKGTALPHITDYIDGFVYDDGALSFFGSPEGRVTMAETGPNLIANADANTTSGFTPLQNVTLASLTAGTETYVSATCNQTNSTPGIYPIGGMIQAQPGDRYVLRVKGYTSGTNVYLRVTTNLGNLVLPGAILPAGAANEAWVSNQFVVPPGATHFYVGVIWSGFTDQILNQSMYINKIELVKLTENYEYAIADHQGNTRVVFSSVTPDADAPVATFEGNSDDGAVEYQNVATNNIVASVSANHTVPGSKVIRMNQTYITGPARSLQVYPGDKVDMETWVYYEGTSGWGSTSTGMGAFITNVAAAFGGVSGGPGESGAIYSGVNSAYGAAGMAGNQGDSQPSAYLNYILFDKDYKFLDMGWEPVPSGANFAKQKISIPTVYIDEPGYIFVYLSYEGESNNWVYFDDFKVTHTPTNVIQYNEYYPFGLQASTSWTRENHRNDYLYNSGNELNATTGWYETLFRSYDPAVGRFLQVDPLATSYASFSGYNYGLNDPVLMNDPLGAEAEPVPPCDYCLIGMNVPMRSDYGVGGHWADSYSNVDRDFFMLSASAFKERYGMSVYDYQDIKIFERANSMGEAYTGSFMWTGRWGNLSEYHFENGVPTKLTTYALSEDGQGQLNNYRVTTAGSNDFQTSVVDGFQNMLDGLGLIPLVGEVFDGANALIYLARDNKEMAAYSAAAMVPIVGYAASTVKYSKVFFRANVKMSKFIGKGMMEIHHRIPQKYMDNGLFPEMMRASLSNLQALPKDFHRSVVTPMWNKFMRENPHASRTEVMKFAVSMDKVIAPYLGKIGR